MFVFINVLSLDLVRCWSDDKNSVLIHDLSLCLEKQRVDIDNLASIMRGKDHYGNDQLSGQQVTASLRVAGITLDRPIKATWMKAADTIGKGIYSIPVLIETMEMAALAKGRTHASNTNKGNPPETAEDEDSSWKSLLELNSSLPIQNVPGSLVDRQMKQKNVGRLAGAMYQSYNQYQGNLPPKDVVQLALAYSTVYHLGLYQGGIRGAIERARNTGGGMGRVHIGTFIQAKLEYIL